MRISEDNRIVYITDDFYQLERYLSAAEDLHMKYIATNERMLSGKAMSLYPDLMSTPDWPPYDTEMTIYRLVTDVAPI